MMQKNFTLEQHNWQNRHILQIKENPLMKVVYEPKGGAKEYADLACNIYIWAVCMDVDTAMRQLA